MSKLLREGRADTFGRIVLAHGAGAPMTSPFMSIVSSLLAARGLEVVRFDFAYMTARKPPPKAERLMPEYAAVVDSLAACRPDGRCLLIGGKSMGGRVASLIAATMHAAGSVDGLVCLGYPFHPPKKPDQLRTGHLESLACPALIVQGERDPFGTREEVEGYRLSPAITFHWAPDGDHDLAPRARSGATQAQNLAAAADAIAVFAKSLACSSSR